jgi:hypothetical protein
MLVLVLTSCAWIPYQAAFLRQVSTLSSVVVYAIDALFLIDIVFNFCTSYRIQRTNVTVLHQPWKSGNNIRCWRDEPRRPK